MNPLDSFLMNNPLQGAFQRWLIGTQQGRAFGVWASHGISQLRRMSLETVPWSPLRQLLAEATVALVTTSGTHLASDPAFNLTGDATFRIIPRSAEPADLTISHLAYDRTDALRDINLVFPLQRLKELEAEGIIGRVAERHYGFGLCPDAEPLITSGRQVARLLKQDGVDLALLVPALPLCTRSVGLLAREIEAAGITTAALALVREVAVEVRAPRMLYLHWPYGHAMGEPGNVEQQRAILRDLLSMARTAPRPGLLVDLPYRWRRETYPPIDDWHADSAAFTTALAAAIDASPAP